ncbi:hypothetical protein B0H10DRAFT_1830798, partial [Mycena sp. CBHHK59/15]
KIGMIQRRLAWPLHKDDMLSGGGRSMDLNIYFFLPSHFLVFFFSSVSEQKKADQVVVIGNVTGFDGTYVT